MNVVLGIVNETMPHSLVEAAAERTVSFVIFREMTELASSSNYLINDAAQQSYLDILLSCRTAGRLCLLLTTL